MPDRAALAALAAITAMTACGGRPEVRGTGDLLTIAATGDSFPPARMRSEIDPAITRILTSASFAVTNLDENLLNTSKPQSGTKQTARDLRMLGFTMVSLANNHAIDYGTDGLAQTERILDDAGLPHAGSGADLAAARATVFVGQAPRRIAAIAVATSASAESRATASRGEILGRPGASVLRYAPDVTVDDRTFATLRRSPVAEIPKDRNDELIVAGKTIRRGARTSVAMIADQEDSVEILTDIRRARTGAGIVIVMLHSHEPSNRSEAPAAFVEEFARSAIDAGASLVIGHGPHRLRGIEVYKGGVIFYSLGNFAWDAGRIDPNAEDVYDAGADLYRLAVGANAEPESPVRVTAGEGVIATAEFHNGALTSVQLRPIDPAIPRLANTERSREILKRLSELSKEFGTSIRVENGVGVVYVRATTP